MKLLDQLIRYEHKEWIRLHKLHVGAAGLLTITAIVAGVFVLSGSSATTAASANTSFKQNSTDTQTNNSNSQVATAPTQPTTQSSTSPSTGVSSTTSTHVSTTPNKSATAGSTTTGNPASPAPTTPTTPTPTQPPTLEEQYPSDYPSKWATPNIDTAIDSWGMSNRESTSYTAWKVNEAFGNMPNNWGNATNWPQEAQATGFTVSTTPKIHSVAIDYANAHGAAATGFSAWVEAVNGNQVTVSEYNWGNTGDYDVKTVPASSFSTYIYFN